MTENHLRRWVLAPGTSCTPRVFDPVMDCLGVASSRRFAVSIDAPSVEDYAARLEAVVQPGDIVCGFSLGSLVLAHNLGSLGKARAVVLLSLNPLADDPGNDVNRRRVRDRVQAGEARAVIHENWHRMSEDTGDQLRETVVEMAEATPHLIDAQTELAISRPSAVAGILQTSLPLVFVTGACDQLTPPGPVEPFGAKARRAHVRILEGLGHFALLEAPERVAAAIRSGLDAVLEGQ